MTFSFVLCIKLFPGSQMQIKCKRKLVSVDDKGTMNLLICLHPKDRILVNNIGTMSIAVKFISLISTMPPSPPSECVTWTRPHSTGPKTMEQLSMSASTLLALKNCFLIPGLRLMNYPSMFVVVTDYFVQVFLACEHVWFGNF